MEKLVARITGIAPPFTVEVEDPGQGLLLARECNSLRECQARAGTLAALHKRELEWEEAA